MDDGGTGFGPRWLDTGQVAAAAGVSRTSVYRWIARGRLAVRETDDGQRIDAEELARFLALRRAAAAAGIRVGTLAEWIESEP